MKDFQILRYIKKWRFLIILGMVIGLAVFYWYFSRQQYYYATIDIEYLNSAATEGKTPSGSDLKPEEIRSADIINSALDEVGLNINVDYIRNALTVEAILTSEEESIKKSLLEKGEEYTQSPTNYRVCLSMNSSYSEETVRNLITAIVNEYMTWYGNHYVINRKKPGGLDTGLLDRYDYIIAMDMIGRSIDNMLQYIYSCEDTFRSAQTGLSFYDLKTRLQLIKDSQYEDVYVKTINSGVTKDPLLLRDYYTSDISEQKQTREKLVLEADEMKNLLQVYADRMLDAQSYSSSSNNQATESSGSNSSIILYQVYQIYDQEGKHTRKQSKRIQMQ